MVQSNEKVAFSKIKGVKSVEAREVKAVVKEWV